ncbi:MAG: adenylate kinase [Candidatus Kerfeldbacteria bacterium]
MTIDEGQAKKICLFGPQGSGKGTQGEKISGVLGIPQISPGNIFRNAIKSGTDLGKKVESIVIKGKLVPDEITNELMKERLEKEDCMNGFILDGYPRNGAQAEALDSYTSLTHVVAIDIPDEESVRRISERRVCIDCNITYHSAYKPPKQEGVCDSCGKELIQRKDDQAESIKKRLGIYHQNTEPLFERYEKRGILCRVDGLGSIDEVWTRVQGCLF